MGGLDPAEFQSMIASGYTDMDQIRSVGNDNRYKRYKLLVKSHIDTFGEEIRHRYTAIKVIKDQWKNDNNHLLKVLGQYKKEYF